MPPHRGHTRNVLLLRMDNGTYFVCDEYYPLDNGRIHVLGDHAYATFNVDDFTVEIQKAVLCVVSIIFQAEEWPTPIAGTKDRAAILRHFALHE